MGETKRKWRLAAAAMSVALVGAACGGGTPSDGSALSGTITGAGSSTVFPITEAITEEFQRENPGVQVPIESTGTGGGFEAFCLEGRTDFSNASRAIKTERDPEDPNEPSEAEHCEANEIDYVELEVAVDGLTVVINPENDWAECLTVEELSKIWGPDSNVNNWSQVRDGFPDVALKLYGPGSDSGTFDFFTDAINGEEGAHRTKYSNIGEDDNQAVTGVADDRGAMGYFGYSFFITNNDKVKAVAVDNGDGCVTPDDETVASNTYAPLSRPLFIYVRTDALERPEAAAYFEFYLDTVSSLISDVGYIALADDELANEKGDLQQAMA